MPKNDSTPCANCGTIKLRIHNGLFEQKRLKLHPREIFNIPGYELVGTESYDDYNNYTYFVFQWIDKPIENGDIQDG